MDTPDISTWHSARLNALDARISRWLFTQDPMHTCCLENDAFDEYDAIAQRLVEQLASGDDSHTALLSALTYWFDEELVSEAPLESLARSLSELLSTEASRRGEGA